MVFMVMIYTFTLIFTLFIWIMVTSKLYSRVKKPWLYTLFPTVLLTIPILKQIYILNDPWRTGLSLALLTIYGYYIYRIYRGFRLIEALIIPSILITILLIICILKGV